MGDDDWRQNPDYSIDPFPCIQPALLNSLDIRMYGERGCLVTDFDSELVNPASYTMRLLGTIYWWSRKGDRLVQRSQVIADDSRVKIRRNSMTYLLTQQEFRLPQYIAARFNLHIRYVHKGLLLGTGPLVDPGFAGSLLIPLHNLTDNEYEVRGGNPILWVEFTKLSQLDYWKRPLEDHPRRPPEGFVDFRRTKYRLGADTYFEKALEVSPSAFRSRYGVQSAFKGALDSAHSAAQKARRRLRRVTRWGSVGVGALLIGVLALVVQAVKLTTDANEMQRTTQRLIENFEQRTLSETGTSTNGTDDTLTATGRRQSPRTANQDAPASGPASTPE